MIKNVFFWFTVGLFLVAAYVWSRIEKWFNGGVSPSILLTSAFSKMAEVNSVLSRCCRWWYFIQAVSSIRAAWHSGNSADSNKTGNDRTGKCSQHKCYTCISSYTSHSRSYEDKDTSVSSGVCWWWWFWEWSWARRSNWCDTRATKTGRGSCLFHDGRQESKSEFCYAAKNLFIMLGVVIRLCVGILRSCGFIHGGDEIYHFFRASGQAVEPAQASYSVGT